MSISQKCQYALRAILELAKRHGRGPLSAARIAAAQTVPPRFLELILGELRQGGFIDSRRGIQGGYLLVSAPEDLTVGEVLRFVEGPVGPVRCVAERETADCPLQGSCAFLDMWEQARDAVEAVYDSTTFQDLIDRAPAGAGTYVADYCI